MTEDELQMKAVAPRRNPGQTFGNYFDRDVYNHNERAE